MLVTCPVKRYSYSDYKNLGINPLCACTNIYLWIKSKDLNSFAIEKGSVQSAVIGNFVLQIENIFAI